MTLLIDADALARRREEVRGGLAPLAASLRAELQPLLAAGPRVPDKKALMSRHGGRCTADGTLLQFDPYSPDVHRCPACGRDYVDDRHHRAWIMSYQLWLAERAVWSSVLSLLTDDRDMRLLASRILERYADAYLGYPNRDNVLGPTRPFFSTYLESIWLLQLCLATDFLAPGSDGGIRGVACDRIIEPSARLIASYDEGSSNRQVWNNAALLAAYLLLGRPGAAERVVYGASGVVRHLATELLADGSWFEGENYHFFAHRGLWYCITLAERAGMPIAEELTSRFDEGFTTPLATALPDFTFPARRDSQYAVSLRQWHFAETFELGLARRHDARLLGALAALYESGLPRADTGRWRSTADVVRNGAPTALARSDLGWRALLAGRATLPPLAQHPSRSVLLEHQGIAVLRRDAGRVYIALDYGHSGGGHGHPDRLNVLFANGASRWLDDMGTGSYVDPTLHWYRSTLAHNAPLFGGRSQQRADGVLRAHDERGGVGWVDAEVPRGGLAPGVTARRSIVAMPEYFIDQLTWDSAAATRLELPLHVAVSIEDLCWREAPIEGGDGLEDGFAFVRDVAVVDVDAEAVVRLSASDPGPLDAWILASAPVRWWRAVAPGAPGTGERPFYVVRMWGLGGCLTSVWSWDGRVARVAARDGELRVELADGSTHRHARRGDEWHVELRAGGARSGIDLAGVRTLPSPSAGPRPLPEILPLVVPRLSSESATRHRAPLEFTLAESAYRISEESWHEAGAPTARVRLWVEVERLRIDIEVAKHPLVFRAADAADPALDNEHPDINSDGVQLYIQALDWQAPAAWLCVPEDGGQRLRQHHVPGSRRGVPLGARWSRVRDGYHVGFELPLSALGDGPEYRFSLDVIVNDMGPGRERRRGQLVLSGGRGERVYIRGDRQSPERYLHFLVPRG